MNVRYFISLRYFDDNTVILTMCGGDENRNGSQLGGGVKFLGGGEHRQSIGAHRG